MMVRRSAGTWHQAVQVFNSSVHLWQINEGWFSAADKKKSALSALLLVQCAEYTRQAFTQLRLLTT